MLLLLLLPGRSATLCRAEDRVVRPRALLLREDRREEGAIDGRGIVAHGRDGREWGGIVGFGRRWDGMNGRARDVRSRDTHGM